MVDGVLYCLQNFERIRQNRKYNGFVAIAAGYLIMVLVGSYNILAFSFETFLYPY